MSQSAFILGGIALAFLFYVTAKGELPKYIAIFV